MIELVMINDKRVSINENTISAVMERDKEASTAIFIMSAETPFSIKEPYEDVIKKINAKIGGEKK